VNTNTELHASVLGVLMNRMPLTLRGVVAGHDGGSVGVDANKCMPPPGPQKGRTTEHGGGGAEGATALRLTTQLSGNERNTDGSAMYMQDEEDDETLLVGFSAGALYKRADFLDKEEAAKSHPNRTYYFRKPEAAELTKLVQLSTKQLKARPDNVKALHIRAMSNMKLGCFEAAAEDYTAMLKHASRDVVTFYNRGCALEKLGKFQEAISDFSTVLELDPGFAAAAYARGACQNQIGNFDAAINDYNLALSRDHGLPSSPSTSNASGQATIVGEHREAHLLSNGTSHHLPTSPFRSSCPGSPVRERRAGRGFRDRGGAGGGGTELPHSASSSSISSIASSFAASSDPMAEEMLKEHVRAMVRQAIDHGDLLHRFAARVERETKWGGGQSVTSYSCSAPPGI
jgi:tetratricopeptide (TPR) repeat protein